MTMTYSFLTHGFWGILFGCSNWCTCPQNALATARPADDVDIRIHLPKYP